MTLPTARRGAMGVLLASLLLATAAWAAPDTTPTPVTGAAPTVGTMPKVSVSFDKASVADVARSLHEKTGYDILFGPTVQGQVTASFADRPLDVLVNTLALALGLKVTALDHGFVLDTPQAMAAAAAPDVTVLSGAHEPAATLPRPTTAAPSSAVRGRNQSTSAGGYWGYGATPLIGGLEGSANSQQSQYDQWLAQQWQQADQGYRAPGDWSGYYPGYADVLSYGRYTPILLPNGAYINPKGQMVMPDGTIVNPTRQNFGTSSTTTAGGTTTTRATGSESWLNTLGPTYHAGQSPYFAGLPPWRSSGVTVGSGWRTTPPAGQTVLQFGAPSTGTPVRNGPASLSGSSK